MSENATPAWLNCDVFVPEVPRDFYDKRLYRAMEFLLTTEEEL